MKENPDKFCLEYDPEILAHPEAFIVELVTMTEFNDNPLDSLPNSFKQWTYIVSSETGKCLTGNNPYNYTTDLK
jgi:hypothetical protein